MDNNTMQCANCDHAITYLTNGLNHFISDYIHYYSRLMVCLNDDKSTMKDENGIVLVASRGEE